MPPPPPPLNYNTWLPGPYESGYDQFMTLHFRTPAVSGVYGLDSGNLTATPPVPAVQPYRMETAVATVMQYDGLTGQYIQLSQYDAHRVVVPLPVMPPAQ